LTFRVFIWDAPFRLPADSAILSPRPFADKSLINKYRARQLFCRPAGGRARRWWQVRPRNPHRF